LQGCSAVRIGYNQAPTLAWWWVDSYMDFNTEQAPRVKDALNQWFAWHRKTQLPEYARLLATAQVQVLQPATPEQVCRWSDELRGLIGRAIDHGVPLAADALWGLTAEQLAHLERKYQKSNQGFTEDFLQAKGDERLKASLRRTVERAEMIYGRLDEPQRQLLAEGVAASPFDPALWYAERQAVQRATLQTLTRLAGTADPARAEREARLADLQALATRLLRTPSGPYRAYQQRLTEYNCVLLAQLHNSTTPAQREAARGKLRAWEEDFRALAAQGPGPAAETARPRVPQLGALSGPQAQPMWSLMLELLTAPAGLAQVSSSSKALSPFASVTPLALSASKG
jgi:hypothetical protein